MQEAVIVTCVECGNRFTFDEEFYRNRGFRLPKRCPSCTSKRKNIPPAKYRRKLLYLKYAQLDIPKYFRHSETYLRHYDRILDSWKTTCLRFFIRSNKYKIQRHFFTVYDQRNTDEHCLAPLEGSLAIASVRVMEARGEKGRYKYIVLDHPRGQKQDGRLVVAQSEWVGTERQLFTTKGYSVMENGIRNDGNIERWFLNILGML